MFFQNQHVRDSLLAVDLSIDRIHESMVNEDTKEKGLIDRLIVLYAEF